MSGRSSEHTGTAGVQRQLDMGSEADAGGQPDSRAVEAIVGSRTFDVGLYDEETFDDRRPAYYRTGKTTEGYKRPRAAGMDRAPPTEAVADFMADVNGNKTAGKRREVALLPTVDELREFKREFDNRERHYEPHYLRVPFFHERVIGDAHLAALYQRIIGFADHGGLRGYSHEVDVDYDAGEVTITVTHHGESN